MIYALAAALALIALGLAMATGPPDGQLARFGAGSYRAGTTLLVWTIVFSIVA